jgi:hypothetical protein
MSADPIDSTVGALHALAGLESLERHSLTDLLTQRSSSGLLLHDLRPIWDRAAAETGRSPAALVGNPTAHRAQQHPTAQRSSRTSRTRHIVPFRSEEHMAYKDPGAEAQRRADSRVAAVNNALGAHYHAVKAKAYGSSQERPVGPLADAARAGSVTPAGARARRSERR